MLTTPGSDRLGMRQWTGEEKDRIEKFCPSLYYSHSHGALSFSTLSFHFLPLYSRTIMICSSRGLFIFNFSVHLFVLYLHGWVRGRDNNLCSSLILSEDWSFNSYPFYGFYQLNSMLDIGNKWWTKQSLLTLTWLVRPCTVCPLPLPPYLFHFQIPFWPNWFLSVFDKPSATVSAHAISLSGSIFLLHCIYFETLPLRLSFCREATFLENLNTYYVSFAPCFTTELDSQMPYRVLLKDIYQHLKVYLTPI